MAEQVKQLSLIEFDTELRQDSDALSTLISEIYSKYLAVIGHEEFPRLLELYKRKTKEGITEQESGEYDVIYGGIFRMIGASFQVMDHALAIHSKY